jgi:hypothetical protein
LDLADTFSHFLGLAAKGVHRQLGGALFDDAQILARSLSELRASVVDFAKNFQSRARGRGELPPMGNQLQ